MSAVPSQSAEWCHCSLPSPREGVLSVSLWRTVDLYEESSGGRVWCLGGVSSARLNGGVPLLLLLLLLPLLLVVLPLVLLVLFLLVLFSLVLFLRCLCCLVVVVVLLQVLVLVLGCGIVVVVPLVLLLVLPLVALRVLLVHLLQLVLPYWISRWRPRRGRCATRWPASSMGRTGGRRRRRR